MVPPDDDPLADWPARARLYDPTGRLVLVYTMSEGTRDERPWVDGAWRPDSAPVEATSRAIIENLPGFTLSTSDSTLVEALTGAGATYLRHARAMSHPLRVLPAVTANPRITVEPLTRAQLERHAEQLGAISYAAYSPGHPDHSHDEVGSAVDEIRAIGRGEVLGPFLEQSRVALHEGAIVGVCLVVDREGSPPDGGPWVVDIFRDPACEERGVATALLAGTLASTRAAGLPGLSLAVSHPNANAKRLYAALGFVDRGESWTLALPSRTGVTP